MKGLINVVAQDAVDGLQFRFGGEQFGLMFQHGAVASCGRSRLRSMSGKLVQFGGRLLDERTEPLWVDALLPSDTCCHVIEVVVKIAGKNSREVQHSPSFGVEHLHRGGHTLG